eukprot:5089274-Amphidinium_carterae.1
MCLATRALESAQSMKSSRDERHILRSADKEEKGFVTSSALHPCGARKDEEANAVGGSDGDPDKFFCKLCTPQKHLSRAYFSKHLKAFRKEVDAEGWVLQHDWFRYKKQTSTRLGVHFNAAVAMRAAAPTAEAQPSSNCTRLSTTLGCSFRRSSGSGASCG